MSYVKGKLFVRKSGFYYVYAKTCFRYYAEADVGQKGSQSGSPHVDVSNAQLIQYVYHESIKQNSYNSKPTLLMKTGSTMRWDNTSYNMYCAQQGRGVRLEEGDTLFVNVSNAWMLDREREGTYFGAIKLGNWDVDTWGADMLLNIWYAKEPLLLIYMFYFMLICLKKCFIVNLLFSLLLAKERLSRKSQHKTCHLLKPALPP